jgi:myo-inositol 2-dehydrogenase / D-chiro-inositol 1-dehydrogenase
MRESKIRVGLCGTGFIGNIHAHAIGKNQKAELVAVCEEVDQARGKAFAKQHKIKKAYNDFEKMIKDPSLDLVYVCIPNYLHCKYMVKAAAEKKHVFVEKPLCVTLEEADKIIAAARKNQVKLFYGENLCFAPKFARLKELVDEGSLGRPFYIRHRESHGGPHAAWFWDIRRSGGGAMMDMGCHGIEFARWLLGKPKIKRVLASLGTYIHKKKTRGEDDSVLLLEFEGGARAVIENSWALRGGLDDRAEVQGTEGVAFCDLVYGSALRVFTARGLGYAVEKAESTKGWSFVAYQEEEMYGYPDEFANIVESIEKNTPPKETPEDGKIVLETMMAGYLSAKLGRWVELPAKLPRNKKPYQLWKE